MNNSQTEQEDNAPETQYDWEWLACQEEHHRQQHKLADGLGTAAFITLLIVLFIAI